MLNNFIKTGIPDSLFLWHLPPVFPTLSLISLVIINLIINKIIVNFYFAISQFLILIPLYFYLLLALGLKHIIINLTQTTQPIIMSQAICFGYLIVNALIAILAYLSYAFAIIKQFKKPASF